MATYIEYYEIKTPNGVEYYFARIENESAMGYLPGNTIKSQAAMVETIAKTVFKADSNRIWRYNTETEEVRWMKNVDVGLMAPVDMDEFRGIQWMSAQNNISNSIIDHHVTTTKFINEFVKANKPYR
jgi:hypothetical protein